jgi:hypothetical protein
VGERPTVSRPGRPCCRAARGRVPRTAPGWSRPPSAACGGRARSRRIRPPSFRAASRRASLPFRRRSPLCGAHVGWRAANGVAQRSGAGAAWLPPAPYGLPAPDNRALAVAVLAALRRRTGPSGCHEAKCVNPAQEPDA